MNLSKKYKIDFVIAWVDGSDPKWLSEKNKYSSKKIDVSNSINRYRDWDNLKYWFRGVEKFAPWVHKIYFITYGHIPSWLNIDNPKLVIVNHKDYIPQKYLPTFSSHVIELNMHKINNLSEHFVYFNDDMFITDFCTPDYFFKDGMPCDVAAINATVPDHDDYFYKILNNCWATLNGYYIKNKVLKSNFNKWFNLKYGKDLLGTILLLPWHNFVGFKVSHMPTSFLKSTFNELWNKEYDILNRTCLNKFRTENDVNQYLFEYWQVASGFFHPRKKSTFKYYRIEDINEKFQRDILKHKYKMVCINDNNCEIDFVRAKEIVNQTFETILPEKSSYERSNNT